MKEPSGNGYVPIIAQAIEEMKAEWGDTFSLEQINLAELERRTGISRGKLRRLKKNGFQDSRRNGDSGKHKITKLTGYSGIIDTLLKQGVSNSTVILNRLQESGFEGKLTIVKDYIAAHKYLLPPSASRLHRRATEVAVIPQIPVRPTRWTGALPMCWITTETSTAWPALP